MAEITELLRSELRAVLAANWRRLCDGLQAELTRPHPEQPIRPLQFEADPHFWDIASIATEEPVFEGRWLEDELASDWYDRCDANEVDWIAILTDEVCQWFAESWQAVGGPARFSPAFLFLHDYHDQQYHLERCCWVPIAEVFGE